MTELFFIAQIHFKIFENNLIIDEIQTNLFNEVI